MTKKYPPKLPFIRKLYADLPEEELIAAEERFIDYIELCIKIGARLPVADDLDDPDVRS